MKPHQTQTSVGRSIRLLLGGAAVIVATSAAIGMWRSSTPSANAERAQAAQAPAQSSAQNAVPVAPSASAAPRTDLVDDEPITTRLTAPEFWDALNAVNPGEHNVAQSEGDAGGNHARRTLPIARPMARSTEAGGDRRLVRASSSATTYRTVCVRLCDGFFWPVSFAAAPKDFARDQQTCSASCDSDVRLFSYRNGGSGRDDPFATMQDLDGAPYTALKTAYLFRNTYNNACKCKPHPWEAAAQDRHNSYPIAPDQQAKSKAATTTPWADLPAKIATAQAAAQSEPVASPVASEVPARRPTVGIPPRKADQAKKIAPVAAKPTRPAASMAANGKSTTPSNAPATGGVVMLYLGARPPITVRFAPAL